MSTSDDLKAYVNAWREVAPILEAMRDEELRTTPLPVAMAQLSGWLHPREGRGRRSSGMRGTATMTGATEPT